MPWGRDPLTDRKAADEATRLSRVQSLDTEATPRRFSGALTSRKPVLPRAVGGFGPFCAFNREISWAETPERRIAGLTERVACLKGNVCRGADFPDGGEAHASGLSPIYDRSDCKPESRGASKLRKR